MSYINCVVISLALMAISLTITTVIKSFLEAEEKGLYRTKVIVITFLNALVIWLIVNAIKKGGI